MFTSLIISFFVVATPASAGAMAPNLVDDNGTAWMSWVEPIDTEKKIMALKCAKFEDGNWSDAHTIVQGNNFFANWADFPEIGVANDGTLFVTWPQQSGPGTYAYDIAVARSDNSGKTWSLMGTLNDDRVLGEHGFVSLLPEGENGVRAFWLDGRAMTGDGHSGEGEGDMQLRSALVDDTVHKSTVFDDRVCECCGTDAALVRGKPFVVYRDRSENEVRDICITTLDQNPKLVNDDNWKIAGCPVNGPSIDAIENSSVVAWYTAPTPGIGPAVYVSFATNDDREKPIQISTSILGRVDVVMLEPNIAVVAWLEPNGETASIMLAEVHRDGTITNRQTIASVSPSRSSGFPRIIKVKGGILAAWTDVDRELGISTTFLAEE
jgi:hypothetical protein